MTKEKRIMASITDEKRIMASLQHSDFVIKALEITQSPVNALITELEPCSLQQFVEFGWCNVSDADAKHVWTPEVCPMFPSRIVASSCAVEPYIQILPRARMVSRSYAQYT